MMRTIELDSELQLDEGTFRVADRLGNRIQLQNLANGEFTVCHIGDLAVRLVAPTPAVATRSPRALDHLSKQERQQVNVWADHIEEMISGINPEGAPPRSAYDPAITSMNERVAAKVTELRACGMHASRTTLFEKKKAYEAGGPAALIDGRKFKQVGKLDKANEKLIAAIVAVVESRTQASTVSEAELHRRVNEELRIRHATKAPTLPSRATLYRYFDALYGGTHTGTATRRRSDAGTPNRLYGTSRRMLPGQEMQIDSTTLDLYVKTKTGPQRPLLTMMIDVATRTPVAFSLRLEGTTGYDHSMLLAQALTTFGQRPDRSEHRALISSNDPRVRLLSPEERKRLEDAHPVITPRYIITDNGKDYLSDTFRSTCAKFNVDIVRSAIHTPTDKPYVERNFGSVGSLFLQGLPGYVSNSTSNRGRHPEKEDLYDLATLTEVFDDWLIGTWQYRPHKGLRDPYDPSQIYSPNQWFASVADLAGSITLPLTRDDYIDLLPSAKRKIGTLGVQFNNRHYDSVELQPHRGMPSNLPHLDNSWEVKYAPYDVTRLWVRSPENTWIECRSRDAFSVYQPHFADISKNLRATERAEVAMADLHRAGAIIPLSTHDPMAAVSSHAWDPQKHVNLDMFELEGDEEE